MDRGGKEPEASVLKSEPAEVASQGHLASRGQWTPWAIEEGDKKEGDNGKPCLFQHSGASASRY